VLKLKSGQAVTLECRSGASSAETVVESIKKRFHKNLVILGLILVAFVVGVAVMVSEGPI